jgi:cytoskeletal protein RodZ
MMESLGQLLQQARQARGISLEQAAQATHIRLHYLQALEADDRTALPSPVQARGFLRLYAGYLGLNPDGLSPSGPVKTSPAEQAAAQPGSAEQGFAEQGFAEQATETPSQDESAPEARPAERTNAPAKIPLWKRLIPARKPRPAAVSDSPTADSADDEAAESRLPAGERGPTAPAGKPVSPAPAPRASAPPGPARTSWKTAAEPHGKVVSTESHAILREIGRTLAQRREVLGLAVADIEHYTHVRGHYIQALEEGRIEEFLSPVQARGMLSNYARFMNLEVDALLLRFADALQTRRVENLNPQKTPRPAAQVVPRFSLRRFFTVDLVAGSLLIIAMVAFLFWGVTQVLDYRSSLDATPSLPAVVDVLSPSETATPAQGAASDATQAALTTTPGQATASPTPPAQATVLVTVPPGAASSSLQLYVIAKEQVWLRVVVDGGTAFQGRTAPGAAYNFAGSQNIVLTTGNAAGLQVLFNQTDLGVLGGYAQVVNLVFDANGVQTPTPLATLTRTATPLVSPTLGSLTKTPAGTPPGATPTLGAPTSTPTPRPSPSRTPTLTPTR